MSLSKSAILYATAIQLATAICRHGVSMNIALVFACGFVPMAWYIVLSWKLSAEGGKGRNVSLLVEYLFA